jgi:hypothetical protein
MSRLHHHDEASQDGRHFAQALADAGFPASGSLLSRWESGEIPISYVYISDPAVQVVTTPAGLLDRLPTRQVARLVLEIIEKPQTSLTYATGIWLATQKVIRRDFDPAGRTELDMLVLKAWRRDPGQASADLAELIAELPEGMLATLVQAAGKAGRRTLGYVFQRGWRS